MLGEFYAWSFAVNENGNKSIPSSRASLL